MKYAELSIEEKKEQLKRAQIEFDCLCKLKLSLDLSRGKPIGEQLDLSNELFTVLTGEHGDYIGERGFDYRNYGCLDGIPEAKTLFAELLEVPAEQVFRRRQLEPEYDLRRAHAAHAARRPRRGGTVVQTGQGQVHLPSPRL